MDWTPLLIILILVGAIAVTRAFSSGPSRRELKEQIQANLDRQPIDIRALVEQEFLDLGLDRVPGGEGVDMPVLLRVWQRDAAIRDTCSEGLVQFQLRPELMPGEAGDEDVRLVCVTIDGASPTWQDPLSEPAPGSSSEPSDGATGAGEAPETDDVAEDPPTETG